MRMSPRLLKYVAGLQAPVPDTFEDWLGFLDRFLRGMVNEAYTYEGDAKVGRFIRETNKAMEEVWNNRRTKWATLYLSDALDAAGGLNDRIHDLRRETLRRAKEGIEVWSAKDRTDYWLFEATYGVVSKAPGSLSWAIGLGLGTTMNRLRGQGFQLARIP